jgi:hypothetical protein
VYRSDQISLQGENIVLRKYTGCEVKISISGIRGVYIKELVSYPGFADLLIFEDKNGKVSQVYAGTFKLSGKPLESAKGILKISSTAS